MTSRGGWQRFAAVAAQLAAFGAAGWFLVATARRAWPNLTAVDVDLAPLPLLAASALTAAAYFFMIGTWTSSLRWWGQRLPYRDAAGMWFLTNLARYIPGTVWQFAGLSALAHARGISPLAATGAVLLQQVVVLCTGLLLTLGLAPQLLGAWTSGAPRGVVFALAVTGGVLFVWLFPLAAVRLRAALARLVKRDFAWPVPPAGEFATYVAALVAPWLAYGVAFWLFGRSLFGVAAPGLLVATAAFTASYVAGIVAVFAPGGILVREAALVAALSPQVGADHALVLAVASRVWLVAVELLTALATLAAVRRLRPPAAPES